MIYNELEKTTIFPLRDYVDTHRNHVYQMTFADGECVECTWVMELKFL